MKPAQLPILAEVPAPELHNLDDVARLPNFTAAVRRQVNDARRVMTQSDLAETIKINPAQLSRVLNGKHHMPGDRWAAFNAATGRATALQWVAMRSGLAVTPLEALRAENASLRARMEALEARLSA